VVPAGHDSIVSSFRLFRELPGRVSFSSISSTTLLKPSSAASFLSRSVILTLSRGKSIYTLSILGRPPATSQYVVLLPSHSAHQESHCVSLSILSTLISLLYSSILASRLARCESWRLVICAIRPSAPRWL
jgi:hypothetical protein